MGGDEVLPARMVHDGVLEPGRDLRAPGFAGGLISCPYCNTFWISLALLLMYAATAHWTLVACTPFAAWGIATWFAKGLG